MRKWVLASCSPSPRTAIVFSPRLRAPERVRFSTTDSPNPAKPTTMPISTGSIKRPQRRSRGREEEISASFSTTKKRLYHDLAKLGPGKPSSEQKHLVAERHGLQVVRGKIPVPDMRIEYEAHDGERARVDLELATSHYRGRNLAEKVRAGFSIYAHAEDASKLRRVLDQRELTAEILSL